MTNKTPRLISGNLLRAGVLLALCCTAQAQPGRLDLSALDRYASVAKETVEVAMPNPAVQLMTRLMTASRSDDDMRKLRDMAARVQGVYARGFEFERAGEYQLADLEAIRMQLNSSVWQRLAQVRERNGETSEIYFMPQGDSLAGAAVLSAEPKRLCVINIVGSLTLEDFKLLDREFGVGKCFGSHDQREKKTR